MKINWKPIVKKQLCLGHLKVGDTFMFTDYDQTTGPFLAINPKGYCKPMCSHQNQKAFILNLAENTVHYRTVDASVELVLCNIVVTG